MATNACTTCGGEELIDGKLCPVCNGRGTMPDMKRMLKDANAKPPRQKDPPPGKQE